MAVDPVSSAISGAERIDIEAFRAYDATTVDSTLIGTIQADTDAYMTNASSIESALGVDADPRFHLLPGVEIRSAGDLDLAAAWDLMNWRYADEAGVLTLRAAGDLNVNQSLSDGFAMQFGDFLPDGFTFLPEREVVQTGPSWSYRLAAGARTDSADPLGTNLGAGTLTVGDQVHVRTGVGDIDVATGDDFILSTGASSIYTVGQNRGSGAIDPVDLEILLRADFVENGGAYACGPAAMCTACPIVPCQTGCRGSPDGSSFTTRS